MEVSNSGHNAQYDLLLNPVNGGSVGIGTTTASSNYTTQLHVHGSGTGASIHITDNGTGFSENNLKNILKPYFTTKTKGSGLGLSIVNKIINDHNGTINFIPIKNGAQISIRFIKT